jgi:hypothetical protein
MVSNPLQIGAAARLEPNSRGLFAAAQYWKF